MGGMLGDGEYPIAAGIAYLFLSGYLWRSIFMAVGLPASVGVMFSGYLFSFFSQDGIMVARDKIQGLSFFLVLLIAGLEIRIADLRPHVCALACIPVLLEILGISLCAHFWMGLPPQEGVALGTVLSALGEGLVIPKMKEFMHAYPVHPMPKLVFMWAPLEASVVLTTFGIVTGLASPKEQETTSMSLIVVANVMRIIFTILCGALLGGAAGWAISRRTQLTICGHRLFSGADQEAFLMLLSVALFALALGKGPAGHEFVPMGFCSGSMFQPELLVIVTGMIFSYVADKRLVHDVERLLGQLWVFGGIVLFSMLGSKTSTEILPSVVHVLPLMGAGFAWRFTGVFTVIALTAKARGEKASSTILPDAAFCCLCTIPRATIQGALGAVPLTLHFFASGGYTNKLEVRDFIFIAARLYIICTSVCGMILLTTFGPRLLEATADGYLSLKSGDDGVCLESQKAPEGSACASTETSTQTDKGERPVAMGAEEEDEENERDAVEVVANEYGIDYDVLLGMLRNPPRAAAAAHSSGDSAASSPMLISSDSRDGVASGETQPSSSRERNVRRRSPAAPMTSMSPITSIRSNFFFFDTNEGGLSRSPSFRETTVLPCIFRWRSSKSVDEMSAA